MLFKKSKMHSFFSIFSAYITSEKCVSVPRNEYTYFVFIQKNFRIKKTKGVKFNRTEIPSDGEIIFYGFLSLKNDIFSVTLFIWCNNIRSVNKRKWYLGIWYIRRKKSSPLNLMKLLILNYLAKIFSKSTSTLNLKIDLEIYMLHGWSSTRLHQNVQFKFICLYIHEYTSALLWYRCVQRLQVRSDFLFSNF